MAALRTDGTMHTAKMVLPAARAGEPLVVLGRAVDFSFFPMRRTTRRWGVASTLYAADPWGIAETAVSRVSGSAQQRAARSFLHQSREYFYAAERATALETRPVLYYYSFLNLGKAVAISRGRTGIVGTAVHGVGTVGASGHAVSTAELRWRRTTSGASSIADEMHRALEGAPIPTQQARVADLAAQVVVGHRLWTETGNRRERFLPVDVDLLHDAGARSLWGCAKVRIDAMHVRRLTMRRTLTEGALAPTFRAVASRPAEAAAVRTFEMITPVTYAARSSDVVMEIMHGLRNVLWQTVTSSPPYRKYYIYLSPPGEARYPQWLAIYALMFWLGSLTRYQPVELLELLDGPYGPFFREFISSQPNQFLYMMVSELKQQDVARAAVV